MTLKKDLNFEEKLTFCMKNDTRNLVNFNPNSGKSEFELKNYKGPVS